MASSYEQKLLSPPFTFVIGEEKESFSVHSAFITDLSPALEGLVNGQMKEGRTKCAAFTDVSKDTFVRFCQFAYTGDYQPPRCRSSEKQQESPTENEVGELLEPLERLSNPETPADVQNEWDAAQWEAMNPRPGPSRRRRHRRGGDHQRDRDSPRDQDDGWAYTRSSKLSQWRQSFAQPSFQDTRSVESFRPFENTNRREDFSPIFLGHARLYLLADKWCIESLKQLVLGKLHSTLCNFKLFNPRLIDVVQLIRFVYDDERTREEDELRALIVQWVACEVEPLTKSDDFLQLLQDGGKFVEDVWKIVVSKLIL